MKTDFNRRLVVVTGGTGALGTAVVGQLVDAGAHCAVPCIEAGPPGAFPYAGHQRVCLHGEVDLTDEARVEEFYAWATETDGRLWASIHLAGGFEMSPVRETSKAQFEHQLNINAVTCFLCCREAVKRMSAEQGGRIVNVAARPALEPRSGAGMVAYTAAKAAVAAMTQAMAEELVGDNILVNAVVPSIMDTPANRNAMPKAEFSKWATVADVAATIAFLASPQNTCTRGGLVPVFGRS